MEPGCDWMDGRVDGGWMDDGRVDLGGLWKGGFGWMVLRYLDGKFIGWSVFKHLVIKIVSILIKHTAYGTPYVFYQSRPKIRVYLQPMVNPAVIGTKA